MLMRHGVGVKISHPCNAGHHIKENVVDDFHVDVIWFHHNFPYGGHTPHIHPCKPQWYHPCRIGVKLTTLTHVIQSLGKNGPQILHPTKFAPLMSPLQNVAMR